MTLAPRYRGPVADLPPTLRYIPTSRVAPIIRDWMHNTGTTRQRMGEMLAADHDSAKAEGWERRLAAIEHEHQATTTFRVVDAILCTIDRVDAWHVELADLFEVPAWTAVTTGVCPDCGATGTSVRPDGSPRRCNPCGKRSAAAKITTSVRPDTLRCSHCREWLPDEAFAHYHPKVHRRGRNHVCRVCGTIARRKYPKHSTAPSRTYPEGSRETGQKEKVTDELR